MKRNNYKIYLVIGLIAVIAGLSVAFASFSTSLNINSTATISSDWGIIWDNMQSVTVTGYAEAGSLSITDSDTNVTGSIGTIKAPGDTLTAKWDVHNTGSIDAKTTSITTPTLSCTPTSKGGSTQAEATQVCNDLTLSISVEDWGDITTGTDEYSLDAGDSKLVTLVLTYSSSVTTPISGKVEVSISQMSMFNFEQTTSSKELNPISGDGDVTKSKEIGIDSGNLTTVGSEVHINDESFYVIDGTDSTKVVLLSKYNLLVGSKYDSKNKTVVKTYTTDDEGYGLQNENALGYVNGDYVDGYVKFDSSSDNPSAGFWTLESAVDYPYDLNGSYGDLNNYLDYYKAAIEKTSKISIDTIRLLTFSEAEALGCDPDAYGMCDGTYPWLTSSTYWLGTAVDINLVAIIHNNGLLGNQTFYKDKMIGVRPVIVVAKSIFN